MYGKDWTFFSLRTWTSVDITSCTDLYASEEFWIFLLYFKNPEFLNWADPIEDQEVLEFTLNNRLISEIFLKKSPK